MTNGGNQLLQLYWMKLWHANSSVKIYSISPNYVWKLGSFLKLWKAVFTNSWIFKHLTTKQRKNSPARGLDAAFLPNIFRVVEKPWAVFNPERKLFNSAQVAYTKIPRNEAKIYQETDFRSSKERLLNSPGCCLFARTKLKQNDALTTNLWSSKCPRLDQESIL